jgi:hypothetical protein
VRAAQLGLSPLAGVVELESVAGTLADVQFTSGTDRSIAAVVADLTWERDSFLGAAESLMVTP